MANRHVWTTFGCVALYSAEHVVSRQFANPPAVREEKNEPEKNELRPLITPA
jgi:hypothetical protein